MMVRFFGACLLAVVTALPALAQAQGTPHSSQSRGLLPPRAWFFGGQDPAPPAPAFAQSPQISAPETEASPDAMRPPGVVGGNQQAGSQAASAQNVMTLPPEDQPETGSPKELPPNLKRQLVDFRTKEPAGTLIIDTGHTYLYLILGHGKALRYGIGVGREGFTWSGTERVSRMKEWPDWFPPKEMIERQPYLPRMMAGGPGNPLGARALYLGHTLYRIHGTNQPSTIGKFVSSGCIRLLNADIEDLYSRVQVGTRVVVLPGGKPPVPVSANDGGNTVAQDSAPMPAGTGPMPNTAAVTSSRLPPAH
jgi:lipoprotein-anchoring transpeptidase ErfK/SrfK